LDVQRSSQASSLKLSLPFLFRVSKSLHGEEASAFSVIEDFWDFFVSKFLSSAVNWDYFERFLCINGKYKGHSLKFIIVLFSV